MEVSRAIAELEHELPPDFQPNFSFRKLVWAGHFHFHLKPDLHTHNKAFHMHIGWVAPKFRVSCTEVDALTNIDIENISDRSVEIEIMKIGQSMTFMVDGEQEAFSEQLKPFNQAIDTFEILADQSLDSNHFNISGNEVLIASPLNFETQDEYSIRVKGTDPGGLSIEKILTIKATDIPEAPVGITLDNDSVGEGLKKGTTVGNLGAIDQDGGEKHVFAFVDDAEGETNDNGPLQAVR